MQNRYVGEIGNFVKLAVLRALRHGPLGNQPFQLVRPS